MADWLCETSGVTNDQVSIDQMSSGDLEAPEDQSDVWARFRGPLSFVPAALIWLFLYSAILRTGGRFLYEERFNIWQALDPQALAEEFWPSLLTLHIQPPLLNAMYGVTDGPDAPRNLGLLYALASLLTVLMVVHTIRLAGLRDVWAAVGGVLFALLPATVLYSLFPYSTTIVGFLAIGAVWGVALIRTRPTLGIIVSAISTTCLFLSRASFVWIFALCWLVALLIICLRRRGSQARVISLAVLACCGGLVVIVQAHYLISFGTPTLSSWSGQNLFRALSYQALSPEAKTVLSLEDPCFAELINRGQWQPATTYPVCMAGTGVAISGTEALDTLDKRSPGNGINFNNGQLLLLSKKWQALANETLRVEPVSVWHLVVGDDSHEGSMGIFLGRSDVYDTTLDLQKTFAPWLWSLLGVWSAIFPKLAWVLVLLALLRAVVDRRYRPPYSMVFWFASGLLLFHAIVSLVGEYGENQRFRAETDPVLMVAAVLAVGTLMTWRRRGVPSSGVRPSGEEPVD